MSEKPLIHLPAPFYEMAFDWLHHVMQGSDNPQAMSSRLAEKCRELTGAQTVLVFQNLQLFGGTSFRPLTVNPQRRNYLADDETVQEKIRHTAATKEVTIIKQCETCSDCEVCLGVPLLNSQGENVGVILLLNLPPDPQNMPLVLEGITFFAEHVGPTFHNALTSEFQENLIAEKTKALQNEIEIRKENQQKTDQQKLLLETIVDATPGIICLKDGEGHWLLSNDYNLDLFQLTGVDYKGKTDAELAPFSDFYREAFLGCMALDNKAWELKSASHGEEVIPRPNSTPLSFDVIKIPLFNEDGSRHALVVIGNDITERKQSETILKQAKEEWEKTFDAIPDIITIMDKDFRVVRANKAAGRSFGENYENIIGAKCHELFRGTLEPCQGCPGTVSVKNIRNHTEIIEHENLGKTFYVSSSPIVDEHNAVRHLVHVAKDITEQKRLEEELFQAHKMEAIGTLAGGIAHDFNNILSAIMGYSELAMLNIPADCNATKDIDEVLKASRRAAELVKQILTFSRRSNHSLQPLTPHVIIKEALKMLRSSLPSTINIQMDIDNECGEIMADPTNIHQIIVNLCTNALHAMADERGILSISLYRKAISNEEIKGEVGVHAGPFIVLKVSDTGHGMGQDTIERIFEPYYTTKEVGKGTGLGLAVIHGIIQDYHGFIRVQSELEKGTSFYVYIPALQQERSTMLETEITESLPTGTERILVVDDEIMIVNLNKAMLEQLGYKVASTTQSIEALEKIRTDPDQFDLVITDQTMPNLTGADLAQKILKIKPNMPIILCTGYSSVLSEEDALAIGIKKFAKKPVDRTTLAKTVREILDKT